MNKGVLKGIGSPGINPVANEAVGIRGTNATTLGAPRRFFPVGLRPLGPSYATESVVVSGAVVWSLP